ncbi:uncharacterized protein LOC110823676 [Carica papaya]|uniref:uncharacterized protein LOC110823676 n=1 Tax=Carica papaya TaxID=3649 RepID=UPI000B8C9A30|nr:uncharacterized protein LOC110823676 [Carica papaya]
MSATTLASNPIFHSRIKHIEADVHFVCDQVTKGALDIKYVPSCDQTVDCFTRTLSQTQVKYFRKKLGLVHRPLPLTSLRGNVKNNWHQSLLEDKCANLSSSAESSSHHAISPHRSPTNTHGRQLECNRPPPECQILRDWKPLKLHVPATFPYDIDKKISPLPYKIWPAKGEELAAAKQELFECLKTLEKEIGEKRYFGGEGLGLVDVVLLPFVRWFYALETCGSFSVECECSKIVVWAERCAQLDSVAKSLPDPHEIYETGVQLRKKYGME